MANIDLGNLTRYDGKIKDYAEDKYLSKNTANWQMTEKAGAVTCYPVPESELEPIVDFMFTETPPAEGEKSPSNPSTIAGVESINIKKAGKNLFNFISFSGTKNGVTVTTDSSGIITLNGTSSANNGIATEFTIYSRNIRVAAGKKLSLSYQNISGTATAPQGVTFVIGAQYTLTGTGLNTIYTAVYNDVANKNTILLSENRTISNIIIKSSGGTVYDNYKIKVQLEINDACTDYEPPVLDVSTVLLNGTYYGGSIDLATGLMTVTWKAKAFDGSENWQLATNVIAGYKVFYYTGFYMEGTSVIDSSTQVCTHYPSLANLVTASNHFYLNTNRTWIVSEETTVEGFKEFLSSQNTAGTPVTVVCRTTPFTVQLTPQQIKSLSALDKNIPRLNTLYTDADNIQVGYQKHPARTSYELENAILALGGGE